MRKEGRSPSGAPIRNGAAALEDVWRIVTSSGQVAGSRRVAVRFGTPLDCRILRTIADPMVMQCAV
jgi:hypothetical protein